MSLAKPRACSICGTIEFTASKAQNCFQCFINKQDLERRQKQKEYLESVGYTDVTFVRLNAHQKSEWSVTHECGVTQVWVYGNIISRLKADPTRVPCSACGGKRRAAKATAGFVAKYGITPEQLAEFTRYSKRVRNLTETVYKQYKNEINPLGLKRGQGPDDYHLDHMVSIVTGFKQGLDPEFIARRENLQMLTSKDNLSKGRK